MSQFGNSALTSEVHGAQSSQCCQKGGGWRRRCLCYSLLLLVIVVFTNLALTLSIMSVLDFSVKGIGRLQVVDDGLVLDGDSWVMGQLIASEVKSRVNQPLSIHASRNFSAQVRNQAGELASQIVLGEQGLEVVGNQFKVLDRSGVTLFSASTGQVEVGAHTLQVLGDGGAVFHGSVETSAVRAEPGKELKLESSTRSVEISAPLGVSIESRAGDVSATCLNDLKLQSTGGMITVDSASVMMPKLPIVLPSSGDRVTESSPEQLDAYQLCACGNGKLFLVPPDGECIADFLTCQ